MKKMHDEKSVKYFENFMNTKANHKDTIEDRVKRGWGKVAEIKGLLASMFLGHHYVEAALLMREMIFVNFLLFSAEVCGNVTLVNIMQLEQVDSVLIRSILGGHPKGPKIALYLETGCLKLRHILSYRRMLYHHHILTLDTNETVSKIYHKQKQESVLGDWYQLLKSDYEYIGLTMSDDEVKLTPKAKFKETVIKLLRDAAFQSYTKEKSMCSKLNEVQYEMLQVQTYLKNKSISKEHKILLYRVRTRCTDTKSNFKSLYKNHLMCRFGCQKELTQKHLYMECEYFQKHYDVNIKYEHIFEEISLQVKCIKQVYKIESLRSKFVNNSYKFLPGGLPGPFADL